MRILPSYQVAAMGDVERMIIKILEKWLQGEGRTPKSWTTIIRVLKEINLNELAKDIKQTLENQDCYL